MSTLSSANVPDVNLVLKECTHMRLCLNMLIFTHNLGNWLIMNSGDGCIPLILSCISATNMAMLVLVCTKFGVFFKTNLGGCGL